MTTIARKSIVHLTVVALLLLGVSPAIHATAAGARLEGLLLAGDGRPAKDFTVHLIGSDGEVLARSTTSDEGVYSFKELEPGEYGLGIESPDGMMAAVAAPPLRLGQGELSRRDLKLVEASQEDIDRALEENPSIGMAYAGWSRAGRIWFWIAIVVGLGIGIAALDDEDDSTQSNP
jgi:hypothetical protein